MSRKLFGDVRETLWRERHSVSCCRQHALPDRGLGAGADDCRGLFAILRAAMRFASVATSQALSANGSGICRIRSFVSERDAVAAVASRRKVSWHIGSTKSSDDGTVRDWIGRA